MSLYNKYLKRFDKISKYYNKIERLSTKNVITKETLENSLKATNWYANGAPVHNIILIGHDILATVKGSVVKFKPSEITNEEGETLESVFKR